MESGIEEAYGREAEDRLHGCPSCCVTWFGATGECWVCGGTSDGPIEVVPPDGST